MPFSVAVLVEAHDSESAAGGSSTAYMGYHKLFCLIGFYASTIAELSMRRLTETIICTEGANEKHLEV